KGPWLDRVYLSTDGTLNGAMLLASVQHDGDPTSGEHYDASANVTLPDVADGTYTIIVQTDAADVVYERDGEGNNVGVSRALSTGHADLSPAIVSAPADGISGTTVPFQWKVTNTGTADALGSWVDRVYLSNDSTLDSGDRLLGELAHVGPLGKGESYTGQLNLALPVELSGPRFFLVQPDAKNQVVELAGENDNVASSPITVTLAPFADLAVSDVNGPTQVIGDPAPISVSWTVTNVGTGAGMTDTWIDHVIASTD